MLGVCTLRVSVVLGTFGAPSSFRGRLLLLVVLFVLAVTLAWRALPVRRPSSARVPWVRLTGPVCVRMQENNLILPNVQR